MKLPEVIAIDHPDTFRSDPELQRLHGGIHLFATDSLRRAMGAPSGGLSRPQCFSFKRVFNEWMGRRWEGNTRLRQYAALGRVLRGMKDGDGDNPLLRAFSGSKAQVLDAIRSLSEAGISPAGLVPRSDTDRLLIRVWQELVKEKVDILRPVTIGALADNALPDILSNGTKENGEPPTLSRQDAARMLADGGVVLHGFYFVTAPQYRLLKALLAAGYRVTFVVMFDPRYPVVFEVWKDFFGRFPLLPSMDQWIWRLRAPDLSSWARMFGSISSGRPVPDSPGVPSEEPPPVIRVHRFRNLGQMLPPLVDPGAKGTVFSPDLDAVRQVIEAYAPIKGQSGARHFFSYPVGQFLLCLYRLSRAEGEANTIVLDEESLKLIFASGLLRKDGVNARDLYHPLEKILPFFGGCREIDTWEERLGALEVLYREQVASFEQEMPPGERLRFHQALGSPLRLLSHLSLEQEVMARLSSVLRHFFHIARALLRSGEISLLSHVQELLELLDTRDVDPLMTDKERHLLRELKVHLADGPDEDIKMVAEDLGTALAWFLGNVDEEKDDARVQPFPSLDALPFSRATAHLVLLSESQFPRREGEPAWPLSAAALEETVATAGDPARLLIQQPRSVLAADMLLFFLALAWSPDLTLSWTEEWQGTEHSPSPCLMMLLDARWMLGLEKEQVPGWAGALTDGLWPEKVDHTRELTDAPPRRQLADPVFLDPLSLPRDVAAIWSVCPRRAVFSYVLERFPTFADELHQSFLIGRLTSRLAAVCNEPLSEVYQRSLALLPQWPELEARASLDACGKDHGYTVRNITGWDDWDGRSYPQARGALPFLNPKPPSLRSAMNLIQEGAPVDVLEVSIATRGASDNDALPAATTGEHCRFCPFRLDCDEALYALDMESDG